jgi:hypothetical protein
MRVLPFRKGTLVGLLAALALPLIPVVTTQIPLKEVLKKPLEGAECVTKGGRSRLLCVTSPVPPGGLREVEVHSAHSTGSLGA